MIRLMFFCLGNICRSPLAEGVCLKHLEARGISHLFHVESSGTSAFHAGEAPDPGSQRVAKAHRFDISHQRAQQLTPAHLDTFHHLIAMSASNLEAARRLPGAERADILLIRDFEPSPNRRGRDVPDPWGRSGHAFEEVHTLLDRCMPYLLDHIIALHHI